ncbi:MULTISPECIES: HlyD family efflux transporter periplasmic adaptor subunit [Pandoraea]|uniref:HlyD family secretion protein n=1 Tax=Pandoraea TaxID=93217 RepID=UPI001F5D46B8|nr:MULTISPECIES: HlyD family efflux transporter periplasmic adaptor subunit [Pandoraea]MCI3206672.1 secretion protein HlyD [Pandoraea sp. LA3]MDN4584700.1 secretion protein HlyD [Pandoraea capi]
MSAPRRMCTNAMTLAAVATFALLAGCGDGGPKPWQGYVEGEFVYVASSQAGTLQTLSVARGQQVKTGDALFDLEATFEIAAQAHARETLASAEAQLRDLGTGKRPDEIAVSAAQLQQAIAERDKAVTQFDRDQAQYAAGGISREQLDASRAGARSTTARVQELQSSLAVARLPGREAQRQSQAAQVDVARASLAQADWQLAQKHAVANAPGRVYDTMYRVGEWVAAGSPVVRLLPPANIKVRFFVPQAALGDLHAGQTVHIACDGCGAGVDARITYVANQAEYTPPVIYSNDTRDKLVYMIEAHPAPADAIKLNPGQPVQVSRQ